MGSIIEINGKCYEIGSEFADKQVVDGLINDLVNVIKTQNNLIDKLKHFEIGNISFETNNIANLVELNTRVKKVEKNIKINKVNNFLLEIRIEKIEILLNKIEKHCKN